MSTFLCWGLKFLLYEYRREKNPLSLEQGVIAFLADCLNLALVSDRLKILNSSYSFHDYCYTHFTPSKLFILGWL